MDYNPDSVVHIIPTNGPENWNPNSTPTSIWAATEQEEDYRNPGSGADHPPNKKSPTSNSRSKSVGRIFFKTKLCCKFRQSACPYNTNCNFAHTVQELQRPGPPSNWHDFREEDSNSNGLSELRQELQIPSFASSGFGVETRSSKGRHCKKFYTGEGCPYGDSCTFIHDESSRSRESVAISLGPGGYGGGGGGNASGPNSKPLNWKTRICNKWETTGYCPFGSKCHFAHGSEELYHHTGGIVEGEIRVTSAPFPESKQTGASLKPLADSLVTSVSAIPRSDVYHVGVPFQRTSLAILRPGQTAHQKWKGPDKISRIYGDWIDDVE